MKPNFKEISIKEVQPAKSCTCSCEQNEWLTPEQIPVKQVYSKQDLEGFGAP